MDSATWQTWRAVIRLAALVLPYMNKDEPETKRVTPLVDDARTITYGDVIVNPNHAAFEIYKPHCGGTAFREIDFCKEQFKTMLATDSGKKYEQFLTTSTERTLGRMQGKEGR